MLIKKLFSTIILICIVVLDKVQLGVDTSIMEKDIFGNSTVTTVHHNAHGNQTGTSTQERDFFRNNTGTTR